MPLKITKFDVNFKILVSRSTPRGRLIEKKMQKYYFKIAQSGLPSSKEPLQRAYLMSQNQEGASRLLPKDLKIRSFRILELTPWRGLSLRNLSYRQSLRSLLDLYDVTLG